jgi:hypothetical protein
LMRFAMQSLVAMPIVWSRVVHNAKSFLNMLKNARMHHEINVHCARN